MTTKPKLKRKDILYPDLSYQIIGLLFGVYNSLGPGYQERYYQKSIANLLKETGMSFQEQAPISVKIREKETAKGFIDFLIEDKIILEIKKGDRFFKSNIDQIYSYLKAKKLKLGILANFTSRGLEFKRIVNLDS